MDPSFLPLLFIAYLCWRFISGGSAENHEKEVSNRIANTGSIMGFDDYSAQVDKMGRNENRALYGHPNPHGEYDHWEENFVGNIYALETLNTDVIEDYTPAEWADLQDRAALAINTNRVNEYRSR